MRTKVSCARSAASAPLPSLRRSQPCSQPWWAVYREAASRCWGVEADGMAGPDSLGGGARNQTRDRKSTRLNSSHLVISYAVFCLKKKNQTVHRSRLVDGRQDSPASTRPIRLGPYALDRAV